MIRNLVRYSRAVCRTTLVLLGVSGWLSAQTTPELREILDRLDRLEKENQALLKEVRALRSEVAGLRSAPESGPPAPVLAAQTPADAAAAAPAETAPPQPLDERLAVQQARIDEMAQTKVEASQKFPIRVTGMALFNAFLNGRNNNLADNPTVASLTPEDSTGGATLRQTTIGLLFNGPRMFAGGKVSGSLFMDFFQGSTLSLNHVFRIRTAAINLDWTNTRVMIGQDKPLISPRDPDSLAQVGVSPLTSAGNPWLWQPQVRVEHRIALDQNSGLRAQAGIFQTSLSTYAGDPSLYNGAPVVNTEYSRPAPEARLEYWRQWGDSQRIEIAGGFHYGQNRLAGFALPTNVYSVDWFYRPLPKLEFSGLFFHGRNVSPLGALRQGVTILADGRLVAVRSNGGWAQIRVPVTARLTFNVYGGQQDDRNADLLYGAIAKNQAYFGNMMYRLAPNVIVSLEGGQVRTTYLGIGNRLNDHYDVAVAYLF